MGRIGGRCLSQRRRRPHRSRSALGATTCAPKPSKEGGQMRQGVPLIIVLALAGLAACGGDDTGGSGSNGSTGAGGGGQAVNGCDASSAEDHTADATTTVTGTASLTYSPKCITIHAGAKVTFNSDFSLHPLVGGTVDNGKVTPDSSSPIKSMTTGMSATFDFPSPGTYGYYCNIHGTVGMNGAIIVQ